MIPWENIGAGGAFQPLPDLGGQVAMRQGSDEGGEVFLGNGKSLGTAELCDIRGTPSCSAHQGGQAYDPSLDPNACIGLGSPCTGGLSEECGETESRFYRGYAWANARARRGLARQDEAPGHKGGTGG